MTCDIGLGLGLGETAFGEMSLGDGRSLAIEICKPGPRCRPTAENIPLMGF